MIRPGNGSSQTGRAEIRLYAAAVLRQLPEEPLQPVPLGPVWLATDSDVGLALRMDGYTGHERATGIPVGLYAAGGLESPVYLDADFLLGPGGGASQHHRGFRSRHQDQCSRVPARQHLQDLPGHKGTVAALCFNVKGPDLCFLDQPAALSAQDERRVRPSRPDSPSPSARFAITPRSNPMESISTRYAPTKSWPRTPSR